MEHDGDARGKESLISPREHTAGWAVAEAALDCVCRSGAMRKVMRSPPRRLLICALAAAVSLATAEPDKQVSDDVIAVNVLLVPDQQMISSAQGINGALRQSYPVGFALDASHLPHISVLQGYVPAKGLADVYGAVGKIAGKHPLVGRQLTVDGLEHKPWNDEELTNIKIEKTPELDAFQADLVTALSPYLVEAGDRGAFITSRGDPGIDRETIEYVRTFVQKHTGNRFEPHITVGISDPETARRVSVQEETPAKLTIASVAIYQLGNVGTARKELWRYPPR